MTETQERPQQVVLIGVEIPNSGYRAEESLEELGELVRAAGGEVCGTVLQHRTEINNATYIGKGKLQEVKDFCATHEVDLVIADEELSGAQIRNLEEALQRDVIDRTMLILDIFARRALSREGRLQVELAQQRYLLPRLIGMGKVLSRQGASGGNPGIGTRGPGETRLESDRRHIRRRIQALERALAGVSEQRKRVRARRSRNGVPTVALVGYTNVGKSTLLNRLTEAGVLVEDQLFATLDPTARELLLPDGRKVILLDTVGLISRLPHPLIQAFHSTLEAAMEADVLVHVCDLSSEHREEQMDVCRKLLDELGCGGIPMVTAFNKADRARVPDGMPPEGTVYLSAKTGEGIDRLLWQIAKALPGEIRPLDLLIPYARAGVAQRLRACSRVCREEYRADGLFLQIEADEAARRLAAPYVMEEGGAAAEPEALPAEGTGPVKSI